MRIARHVGGRPPPVSPKLQRTLRRDLRIFLTEGPGGGIARVGKEFAPRLLLHLIERCKVGARHVDLAAHFEHLGHTCRQLLRNIGDMASIGGHILAHLPITSGGCAHQLALLIAKRAGEAVDLVLGGDRNLIVGIKVKVAPDPLGPFLDVLAVKPIVEAHHANLVSDFA